MLNRDAMRPTSYKGLPEPIFASSSVTADTILDWLDLDIDLAMIVAASDLPACLESAPGKRLLCGTGPTGYAIVATAGAADVSSL